MLELESRMEESERAVQMALQANSKKLTNIASDSANYESQIRKNQCGVDLCHKRIAELQEELLEFKLRKEAKIQKILNGSAIQERGTPTPGSGSDEAFKKMVIEKIRAMSKEVAECMRKEEYQAEKEELGRKLARINDEIGDRITTETYDNLIYYLEKSQNKQLQAFLQNKAPRKPDSGEEDSHLLSKVAGLSRELEAGRRRAEEADQKLADALKHFREAQREVGQLKDSAAEHGDQFRQIEAAFKEALDAMGHSIEKKVGELEVEVLDIKEKSEKQDKLRDLKRSDPTSISEIESATGLQNSKEDLRKSSDTYRKELHNEMAQHSKKLNKIYLSSSQQREELARFTEQIRSELDELRAEVDRKADHESVKKSFLFVENKVSQIVNVMIQNGQTEPEGDSLIAKKHWSCLSCDKNLDKFEGRLGEVRFTSVFPPRFDSPRIGGTHSPT